MKLFTAAQIRLWDQFTQTQEPVSSIDLMERAAQLCAEEIVTRFTDHSLVIFCGTGNNGGDGLALARILRQHGFPIRVFICGNPLEGSSDFRTTYSLLNQVSDTIPEMLSEESAFPSINEQEIVLDAILGTGINRPVEGWIAALFGNLNASKSKVVSIDLPSGLQPDLLEPQSGAVIHAHHTLTFQQPKLAFLFEENAAYCGDITVLDIGLHVDFLSIEQSDFHSLTAPEAAEWIPPRNFFGHKKTFGHVQVIAGSYGKMGAAVLSAQAALRGGAGLVTASIPKCGYSILQTAAPEVMCTIDAGMEALASTMPIAGISALAIGPGIGTAPETSLMVRRILQEVQVPIVLDADALNILGSRELLDKIPKHSILTPHPLEFDRLFGAHTDSFTRLHTLREMAVKYEVTIVLKGAHTRIATPYGQLWFNFTGNAGMATAGSGDVLTGIIAALLARGMNQDQAAISGVFLHGLSGDIAANEWSDENLIASDLIQSLPAAMREIRESVRN